MKKNSYKLLLTLPAFFCLTAQVAAEVVDNAQNYTLEQVVVFSRHGLRAPLASPSSTLGKVTPNQWPTWDTPASYLTTRGGVLESYFGHYFSEWLVDTKLLKENECPTKDDVFFYSNSLQRTIATAQYFSVGAFPGCIVPVNHKEKLGVMDATFNPIITQNSEEFKQQATNSINQTAGEEGVEGLNKRLDGVYKDMADIISFANSANCEQEKVCDFTAQPVNIKIVAGEEPGISGALRTGTSIADAFILQYYEGAPLEQVAWGKIKTNEQFEKLVSIKELYNTVTFSAPVIAQEVSANLVSYINQLFDNKESAKFSFLVGHDSNVASLFSALKIKPYTLPNQFETTPIGGKVLFERWKDPQTGNDLLKIEYVYQSTDQIRQLQELNRSNPPQRVTLEMQACPTDANGFCPFSSFQTYMTSIAK